MAKLVLLVWLMLASSPGQAIERGFEAEACWFDAEAIPFSIGRERCGYLTIPERHGDAGSTMLRLPVVVFEPDRRDADQAPILYLLGGPGEPGYIATAEDIGRWWDEIDSKPWLRRRSVVVHDQRGTGPTPPHLACPELDDPLIWVPHGPRFGTMSQPARDIALAASTCVERLEGEGWDLGAYTSRTSARDLAVLREALSIDSWSVYGVSYGSRLALTLYQIDPDGVAALVLDSVFPPHVHPERDEAVALKTVLARIAAECAAQPDCRAMSPDLTGALSRLVADLEAQPMQLPVRGLGHSMVVLVDGGEVLRALSDDLYDPELVADIPSVVADLAGPSRRGALIDYVATPLIDHAGGGDASGLYYAVHCGEEIAFQPRALIEAVAAETGVLATGAVEDDALTRIVCAHWPSDAADPADQEPVTGPVAALVLAGVYDPITPAGWADAAAQYLPNAQVFVFDRGSHGLSGSAGCVDRMIADFLDDPTRPVSNSCPGGAPRYRVR